MGENKKKKMMKKIIAFAILIGIAPFGRSQVQVPQLSPKAEIEQVIGLSEVEIEYSRPSKRERVIFGDLIPYGTTWRFGANKNTTIELSTDATIAGNELPSGEYALFAKVGEKEWTIIFYKDTDNWGTPDEFDADKVALKINAKSMKIGETIETFTLSFDNLTTKSADLVVSWENTRIVVPMEFPTDELTEASIKETMKSDSITERDYYGAASYYLSSKKNLKEALSFIDKAIEIRGEEAFWYVRKKALIEYELGMKKQAISTAKKSFESAKAAGNENYMKMNKESIKAWEAEK